MKILSYDITTPEEPGFDDPKYGYNKGPKFFYDFYLTVSHKSMTLHKDLYRLKINFFVPSRRRWRDSKITDLLLIVVDGRTRLLQDTDSFLGLFCAKYVC